MNDNGERLLDICTAFDFQCPQQLQQLARNCLTICTQQDPGHNHHPANSQHSGPIIDKKAGRVSERKGMPTPDRYPA